MKIQEIIDQLIAYKKELESLEREREAFEKDREEVKELCDYLEAIRKTTDDREVYFEHTCMMKKVSDCTLQELFKYCMKRAEERALDRFKRSYLYTKQKRVD